MEFRPAVAGRAELCRVAAHFFLHAERRVESAAVGDPRARRRAEQREDSVAGGLHDVAVVAMHPFDQLSAPGSDESTRFFGIEILHEVHRTLDIGKQRGDSLALAARHFQTTPVPVPCESARCVRWTSTVRWRLAPEADVSDAPHSPQNLN